MAMKKCNRCGREQNSAAYIAVNSIVHNGSLPICRDCIGKQIDGAPKEERWNVVDKLCQWADVPFIPDQWEKIYENKKKDAFGIYVSIFRGAPYDSLDWSMYNEVYLQLKEEERVEDAIPYVREKQLKKLRQKWGQHYSDADLEYLENLHAGMLNSQNIVGALNEDQALKLCKISLIIEEKIREGEDFDKDLKAYDQLAKLANLTPKVVKDAHEFNSVGEVFAYLEKKGWVNKYYDGAVKDEADYTLKNIKYWLWYLYTHESGVAEEIEQRIQNLKTASELNKFEFDEKEFREYSDQVGLSPEEEFSPEL